MISVIMAASDKDISFRRDMCRTLDESFSTLYTAKSRLEAMGDGTQLLLTDCRTFESIFTDAALLIFKDTGGFSPESIMAKSIIAVVDSGNPEIMAFVSGTKFPAVTCGLSPRDTITLSSINVDSAVVNLQRTLTCLDGSFVEPQEIPVTLKRPIDSFTLMAAAAVFILSGNTPKLLHAAL